MSVGFTDRETAEMTEEGFETIKTEICNVYYDPEKLEPEDGAEIRYDVKPWISELVAEGIKVLASK